MILVDSNVLMYAAGAEHPHKAPSVAFLRRVAEDKLDAAIDAEVLQEILHRYRSLGRWSEGGRVYDLARQIFPVVIPITSEILDRARGLMDDYAGLSARDTLHSAVALESGSAALCSYDRDFDAVLGVKRIEPGAA